MFLYHPANLDYNLYHACDLWHMHQNWEIEHWEQETVYTHIWVADLRFRICAWPHCYCVEQVVFWVDVASGLVLAVWVALVEVHPCLCVSSVSGDSVLCDFGKEGSRPSDFPEAWPGVVPTQPLYFYGKPTQLPASSLFRLPPKVAWLLIESPLLWCTKTLLWPFWRYSRLGACQTVLAVPDLLALP